MCVIRMKDRDTSELFINVFKESLSQKIIFIFILEINFMKQIFGRQIKDHL